MSFNPYVLIRFSSTRSTFWFLIRFLLLFRIFGNWVTYCYFIRSVCVCVCVCDHRHVTRLFLPLSPSPRPCSFSFISGSLSFVPHAVSRLVHSSHSFHESILRSAVVSGRDTSCQAVLASANASAGVGFSGSVLCPAAFWHLEKMASAREARVSPGTPFSCCLSLKPARAPLIRDDESGRFTVTRPRSYACYSLGKKERKKHDNDTEIW